MEMAMSTNETGQGRATASGMAVTIGMLTVAGRERSRRSRFVRSGDDDWMATR